MSLLPLLLICSFIQKCPLKTYYMPDCIWLHVTHEMMTGLINYNYDLQEYGNSSPHNVAVSMAGTLGFIDFPFGIFNTVYW